MASNTLDHLGKLLLRVTVGGILILHGFDKLFSGISGIEGMVMARGLPALFAWAVFIGELIAPALVILGWYARLGGLLIAANMVTAVTLAHTHQIFQLNQMGGWQLELQGLFLFGGLCIALLGAGRYSVAGANGVWN